MKHMARYYIPGSFVSEEATRELPERSIDAALAVAPEYAFAFVLYEIEEPPDLGPDFRVIPKPKNESGRHYIGGRLYNLAEVEFELGDDSILASNMRANHWPQVVKCNTGNWQPFEDRDVLVDA